MTEHDERSSSISTSSATANEYDEHLVDDPASFLKCPDCHRTTTTSMTMMLDGDVCLKCEACGATAIANPLNESPRTYE